MNKSLEEIAFDLVELSLKQSENNKNKPIDLYSEFLKKVYEAKEKAMYKNE